jgi:hypothetical protein
LNTPVQGLSITAKILKWVWVHCWTVQIALPIGSIAGYVLSFLLLLPFGLLGIKLGAAAPALLLIFTGLLLSVLLGHAKSNWYGFAVRLHVKALTAAIVPAMVVIAVISRGNDWETAREAATQICILGLSIGLADAYSASALLRPHPPRPRSQIAAAVLAMPLASATAGFCAGIASFYLGQTGSDMLLLLLWIPCLAAFVYAIITAPFALLLSEQLRAELKLDDPK